MYYYPFLGIHFGPSQSGKSFFWLQRLKALQVDDIVIFSFKNDKQYAKLKLRHNAVRVRIESYDDLDLDTLPKNSFILFDELSQELLKRPETIKKIMTIYTTLSHHQNISVCCIIQHLMGTESWKLVELSHFVTMQTQQASNVTFLRYFRIYKKVNQQLTAFLLRNQDSPHFATFFYNCPFNYSILNQILALHLSPPYLKDIKEPDIIIKDVVVPSRDILFSMNPDKTNVTLTDESVKVLKPILEKNYGQGVAIFPISDVVTIDKKKHKTTDNHDDAQYPDVNVDTAVDQMIKNTVSINQRGKFKRAWYFIRNNPHLSIDPVTLVLQHGGHSIGLHAFISALIYPSHLLKSSTRKKSHVISPAAIHMASMLLEEDSFTPSLISNTKLYQAAMKSHLSKKP